ncbi:MAG: SMC-Scp complex subunit ScpB [Pseudomonadota bacterium]|nr:SMC-Scp complex subunit ScpB [Pseudomonadota bacterium]
MDGLSQKENSQTKQTPEMEQDQENLRLLEAILFAATEPVSEKYLANKLPTEVDLPSLINTLISDYEGRGIQLMRIAGNYSFRTAPDLADCLEIEVKILKKLSKAAVETLAIIAYHQPITRSEIEEIRGVSLSRGTLDLLLEIGWIHPVGKRRTPGKPTTWGTSKGFLNHFNLNKVTDLPGIEELKATGLLDRRPANIIFNDFSNFEQNSEVQRKENKKTQK